MYCVYVFDDLENDMEDEKTFDSLLEANKFYDILLETLPRRSGNEVVRVTKTANIRHHRCGFYELVLEEI